MIKILRLGQESSQLHVGSCLLVKLASVSGMSEGGEGVDSGESPKSKG